VDFLSKREGYIVEYYLISAASFRAVFKKYKTLSNELETVLEKRVAETKELKTIQKKDDRDSLDETTKSAPVAKIVSVIIRHAVEGKASDIHIEPLDKETRVRYRIDGILHTSLVLPRSVHTAVVARIKVMSNLKMDETRTPQGGRISLVIDKKEYDLRVSILPLLNSEKVVMRILDINSALPSFKDMGFQGEALKVIRRNIKNTEGMFLITGPTGSGKSTTLFSALNKINKEGVNISTLEDPIEYSLKGVNQSQIKPDIGYTFAAGLRSFLRQDPDVIMVGEIRDSETAELAIHAALTGHYLFSTIHTMSAVGSIARLMDMGVESFLLASTLRTVISQRLVRKICDNCKEEEDMPPEFVQSIKNELKDLPDDYVRDIIPDFNIDKIKFYHGKGCSHCGNTGYKGRLAIAEVLNINKKIQKDIIAGKSFFTLKEIQSGQKYIDLEQDGLIKVIQGLTTIEEVKRVNSQN